MPRRLSHRFVVAAGLLVLTTVVAGVWTCFSLSRLSGVVTDTVRQSESVSAVTSRLAGALEREDDAVLLVLAGDSSGATVLAQERATVDKAVADLFDILSPEDERSLARPLQDELRAYRRASDAVVAVASERDALVQYHQTANPLLRRAVALTTQIRDRHFELARDAVARARDEAAAARRAVLLITLAALGIAVAVAWHLTHAVVRPLRRLTRGANAIREGRFGERIDIGSRDELGELASAFNQMSDDLAEFRRTNIGEVLRAKNTLEATLEALPDAVLLLDAAGNVQAMNRAAVRTLEAAGVRAPKSLRDLTLAGLDLDALATAIAAPVVAPPVDLTRTVRVEENGDSRRLLPRVVPVPPAAAQRAGAVLVLSDVTDLARLDEMRSELVAVASHELQTPLTTLRMTLLMLKEDAGGLSSRHRELVETSLMGVEQLGEIVREFLDLARIEAGQLRLVCEPVHLPRVVDASLARVDGQARELGIRVTADVGGDIPLVRGDALRLRVVLDNILSNALKYTPSDGTIVVECRSRGTARDESGVSIRVIDTGAGVPAAYRARIFDKFFRIEHHQIDQRPAARGAGIGLYMCRQIIELHGGTIACEPGLDERGTCISITLPVRPIASTESIDARDAVVSA